MSVSDNYFDFFSFFVEPFARPLEDVDTPPDFVHTRKIKILAGPVFISPELDIVRIPPDVM